MTHDDGIIKGEARDGVTGSPPRPQVVLPDPDSPDVNLRHGFRLHWCLVGGLSWLLSVCAGIYGSTTGYTEEVLVAMGLLAAYFVIACAVVRR
jgi:hypothetical protein